jgi:2'-5' RNA ligase
MSLYFIAILAPEEINHHVAEWKNYMLRRFHCKVALGSPAHITMIPPFPMQASLETSLTVELKQFARDQQNFTVRLKNFGAFAPRVIYVDVLPDPALPQFKKRIEEFLLPKKQFPVKKEERSFHPHITIANRDLKKEDFPAAWNYFRDREYESSFEANSISLLRHNGIHWEVTADCPFN